MARVIAAVIQLRNNFSATLQQVNRDISNFARQQIQVGRQIARTGKTIESAGKSLTQTVTLPIVGAGVAAVKLAQDFETGAAKVATIADTTQVSLDKLKQGVLKVSNDTGASTSDLNESLYQTISAGVQTKDSVQFMSDAVKLAKGGFTDTTTAIDVLTSTINAYGLKASDAAKISDQLITTQNLGKTTVGDLGEALGNVIPIAASVNVGTTELLSSLAELTKNGIKTDEAVTGLKGAYSSILSPSAEASKMASQIGMDFSAAHLKSVGWAKFLDEIKQKTGGSGEKMAQLFGNVRALNAVMVLAGKGSSDFKTILGQMGNTTGATQKAFEIMEDNGPAKFAKSINKLKNAGIQLGIALSPVVSKLSDYITKVADAFSKLTPQQTDTIVKFALMAATVGPVLLILGKVVKGIGEFHKGIGGLIKSVQQAGGILKWLTSPANLVVIAIIAVAMAAFLIIKYWGPISGFFKKVWDDIKGPIDTVKDKFQEFLDKIKDIKDKLLDLKDKAVKDVKKIFEDFTQSLKDHESQIKTVATVLGVIFAPALIKTGTQAVIAGGQIVAHFIASIIKTGTQAVISAAKTTGSFIASIIKSGTEAVIAGAKITVGFIASLIKTAAQAVITGATITVSLIGSLIAYAAQGWKTVASISAQTLAWLAQKGIMLASAGVTGIMTAAQWALNAALLASPITWIVIGIAALVLAVVGLYEAWTHNWGGIQDKTKAVVDEIKKIWQDLKDFFSHPIQGAINIAKKIEGAVTGTTGTAGHNALGTSYWGGGETWVGENGPEKVILPKGSQVQDHQESVKSEAKSISIDKLADTIIVREESDIDKIVNALVLKLNATAANMG